MINSGEIRRLTRAVFGGAIYRFGAVFFLLLCGFAAFPAHKAVFALAVVVFNLSLALQVELMQSFRTLDHSIADAAERKTRHTILLARQWKPLSESYFDEESFWREVDSRVAAELAGQPPGPKWWQTAGLVGLNAGGRLLSDLVLIGAALFFSGQA